MFSQPLDNQNDGNFWQQSARPESEIPFRIIADTAPVMIWIAGTNREAEVSTSPVTPEVSAFTLPPRYYFNKIWLEFTGKTLEEQQGNAWATGIHPHDLQSYLDTYTAAFNEYQNFQIEYRLRRFDEEYRWILDTGKPLYLADGSFGGYIGSCIDITERKLATAALQERIELLEAVIDNIPDPIYAKNDRGQYLLLNQACIPLFNKSAAEMIGKDDTALFPSGIACQLIEKDRQIWDSGETQTLEEHIPVSGTIRTYSLKRSAYCNSQGNPVGLIGIARDITEQKQVEIALKQVNEQLETGVDERTITLENTIKRLQSENAVRKLAEKALLENKQYNRSLFKYSPIGLVLCRRIDGKLVDVNPAFAAIIGCTIGEALKLNWWNLSPTEYRKKELEQIKMLDETGRYGSYEKEFFHKNGDLVPVKLSGLIIEQNGEHFILSSVEDITERKRAETALRESVAQTRLIADVLPAYISYIDASQRYRWVNKKYQESFKIPALEIAGKSVKEIQGEAVYQNIQENLQLALTGQQVRYEFKANLLEGDEQYLDAAYIPHISETGNVLGCLVFVQDITERKQTEETIQKSNNLLRSMIESTPDVVFVKNIQGCYVMANSSLARLFKTPLEELIGKDDSDFFPPDIVHRIREQDIRIITRGVADTYEELIPEQGMLRTYLTSKSPWRDPKGKVIGLIGISRDISDRKQAEEALQRSEAQLRHQAQRAELLNQLASQIRQSLDVDTILATTVQEIRNLLSLDRCVFIWYRTQPEPTWYVVHEAKNADLSSIVGYYPADGTGTLVHRLSNLEILRLDDVTTITNRVERRLFQSLGYSSILCLPVQTRSGAMGVVGCAQCSRSHSWSDDEVELLMAVCDQLAIAISQAELYAQAQDSARLAQDRALQLEQTLNELQQTQAQLIQTEKMSSLGQMVAGVAHEINNPVNFIHGNIGHAQEYIQNLMDLVQLYQAQYPTPTPAIQTRIEEIELDFIAEDLPKLLTSMQMGTERISQIVVSLRNFSRLDEAEVKNVDLHEGIENTLLILTNKLKKGITVIKNYGKLPAIECYPAQLNQVFMNILSNAIDALLEKTEQQGKQITITTKAVSPNQIIVRIGDNGPGMTPEIQAKIFDPFFTTKKIGQGTGLGLAICYKIIEKHQGKIEVSSQVGVGTEFAIALPIKQAILLSNADAIAPSEPEIRQESSR